MSQNKRNTIATGLRADNMRREMINKENFLYQYEIIYSTGEAYDAKTNEKYTQYISDDDLEEDKYYLKLNSISIPDLEENETTFMKPLIVYQDQEGFSLKYDYIDSFKYFDKESLYNKTYNANEQRTSDYYDYLITYHDLVNKGMLTDEQHSVFSECKWASFIDKTEAVWKANVGDTTHPVYFGRSESTGNYEFIHITAPNAYMMPVYLTRTVSPSFTYRLKIELPFDYDLWEEYHSSHKEQYIIQVIQSKNMGQFISCEITYNPSSLSSGTTSSGIFTLIDDSGEFTFYISGNNATNTLGDGNKSCLKNELLSNCEIGLGFYEEEEIELPEGARLLYVVY